MPKFNVTLLPVIAVKLCGIDAENPAHAVQVARTMLGTPPFYWMEKHDPAPGVAQTYDNDEMPYVMVDSLKGGADPHGDSEDIVASTDWFMVQVPHDMGEVMSAAWAVIQQSEPFAMKEKVAGTPIATAIHNLRIVLEAVPQTLPDLPPATNAPGALFT